MAVKSLNGGGEPDGEPTDFRLITGMDAAANWLLDDAQDDFLPDPEATMVPFLLELDDDAAVAAFNGLLALRPGGRGNGALVLGFGHSNDRVAPRRLLPVIATREWFTHLLDDTPQAEAFRAAGKNIVLSSPLDPLGDPPQDPDFPEIFDLPLNVDPPEDAWPPGTVVVAVIDDGIAFAHERFRAASGRTRVLCYWDMQRILRRPGAPERELTYRDIDRLVAAATPVGGRVDEDAVYAAAGQLDYASPQHKPLAWRVSHGTQVLDLAAGYDPEANVADRPIIAAQLPSPVVARTSGELLDFYVCLGVLYAMDRARRLAPGAALVVNTSFGYLAGAHDGREPLERFLDAVVVECDDPTTRIVLPAGNSQLSQCHATIDFAAQSTVAFDWIVQPEDRTQSVIEVWLPPATTLDNRMALTVTLPDGQTYRIEEIRLARQRMFYLGRRIGLIELIERIDGRRMFRIAIRPTARAQPSERPIAPAGAWRLRFEAGPHPMHGPAHAWVQRDDSLYGHPQRGRQSYFDHPDYVRFDDLGDDRDKDPVGGAPCPVTRASLLSAIASGAHVAVAGGYQTRDNRIARYSSGGPNTPPEPPPLRKPDVLLPSDGSRVHFGMLAAGARSGARVAQDGTSVASPELARHVADMLAAGSDATRSDVGDAAQASPIVGPPAHPDRSGFGRLPRLDRLPVERFLPGD